MKLKYFGSVKDGLIKLPKRVRKEVVNKFDGRNIIVTFERKRKTRSNEQNAYYWGVVIPEITLALIEDCGWNIQFGNNEDHKKVHRHIKKMFLDNGEERIMPGGEIVKDDPSTKYCTTTEFMTYVDDVVKWAAEFLNISIPEPNEQVDLNF